MSLLHKFLSTTCMTVAMAAAFGVGTGGNLAMANPQDGVVVGGAASIINNGNKLDIIQTTDRAVINWNKFDIAPDEHTQFYQPNSSSIILNRVNSTTSSTIAGKLTANGNVILVNPNGILFSKTAVVDVNGLVATTANIDNNDFMNGSLNFNKTGNPNATIENQGLITAKDSGLVGLVAPNVINSGIINAKLGRAQLSSGDSVTIDFYGDGLLEVKASDALTSQTVTNTGVINAAGGTIAMTAAAARYSVNSVVKVSGELHAPTVGVRNGKIIIGAAGSNAVAGNKAADKGKKTGVSTVIVDGVLDATGDDVGEKGGSITITADHIGILEGAKIDASGYAGGGTIHIGGEYLGLGETPTALVTLIQSGVDIKANALDKGNGGEVIIYSDDRTEFHGTIEAMGAGDDGNGGFAETSGKGNLLALGTVRLTAGRRGKAGTWLMDPADITITAATNASNTGNPNFTATATASQVSAASIKANLDAGTNVTITTSNDAYAGNGDITVSSAITTTGTGSLTLSAYRNITLSSAITLQGGSVTLRADNSGAGSGSVLINAAGSITTNGGNITIGGGAGAITAGSGYAVGNSAQAIGVSINAAINAGGGNIIINGQGADLSTDNNFGVYILNTTGIQTSGTGTISINGIGGGNTTSANNRGVLLNNGTIRTTGTGGINIVGTAGNGSGSGANNQGVYVTSGSNIVTTGGGTINVTGTGSASSGGSNIGVSLNGSTITGSGGAVSVTGTGGASTSNSNYGVYLINTNAAITNTGVGTVTITATGNGSGTSGQNFGLYLAGSSNISTVDGLLTINAYGGHGGTNGGSVGVMLSAYSGTTNYIQSTGTGNVVITAVANQDGSASNGGNTGLSMTGSVASIIQTTGSGNITATGTSNTTGSTGANYGIAVSSGHSIRATGTGSITLSGTGSASNGANQHGVVISGTVSANGGTVSITGQGGYGGSSIGISVGAGTVSNTGSGIINLIGTGGSQISGNTGVSVTGGGVVSTVNGALNITGTGGGSGTGTGNQGVTSSGTNSTIKTTGTGSLFITGTGGNSSGTNTYNYGINSQVTGGMQTTGSGSMILKGVAGLGLTSYGIIAQSVTDAYLTTGTGNITFYTDTIFLNSASSVNSVGVLTIAPLTNIGMSLGANVASTLNLSDAYLGYINGASYVFGATVSGNGTASTSNLTVNTTKDFVNKNVTFVSGNDINLAGALTKATGTGTANYLFKANRNIYNSSSAVVSSTTGAVNLTLQSDFDANSDGAVSLSGGTFNTNGGNITIGGGSGTITAGSGYAFGSATYANGVVIGSVLTAAGGNIIINGTSALVSANSVYGVLTTGSISTTGAGSVSINGISRSTGNVSNAHGLYLQSVITTVNGDISLTGTAGGAGTGSDSYGTVFSNTNGQARTSGSGNIIVFGTGGSGSGGNQIGVLSNYINSMYATGTGAITVTGIGGASTGNLNYGVAINGSITGGGGAVIVNGTGGSGSGATNYGVVIGAAAVAAVTNIGSGTVTLNGTGGGTGNSSVNHGVYITFGSTVSTVNGALNIIGVGGGAGTGVQNYGFYMGGSNSVLKTTGTGALIITGTGGNGAGSGSLNGGVYTNTGSFIQTTGTGTMSMTGTGSNSSGGNNVGITVLGSISGAGGAMTLTGTGGVNAASSNDGVRVNAGTVTNTGTGAITVNGYGGGTGASGTNNGVSVVNAGVISTANGALNVTGVGGSGTGGSNHGVSVTSTGSSTIRTTGTGSVTVTGTKGATSGSGIYVSGVAYGIQNTGTGNITLLTDTLSLDTGYSVNTNGILTIAPLTNGLTMGIGSGAGSLSFTDLLKSFAIGGSYVYGSTTTGDLTINTTADYADKNVTFISGGNINIAGTLNKASGTGTSTYLMRANGNITNSNSAGVNATTGSVNLTMISDNDISGAGNIVLTSAPLTVNGGTITLNSNGQSVTQSGTIGGNETINSANGAVSIGLLNGSTAGTSSLTVNAGTGTFTTTAAIGGVNKLNNLYVSADDVVIGASMAGSGILTLQPTSTTKIVRVNSGAGDFNLSTTEIGYLADGWSSILIGNTASGADFFMGTSTWLDPITFRSFGRVTISTGVTISTTDATAPITFNVGWIDAYGLITSANAVTINASNAYGYVSYGSTINASNNNITFSGNVRTYQGSLTLNAGTGTITLPNGVNTTTSNTHDFTATAGTFNLGTGLGTVTALGNVTLNSVNSISLPTIVTAAGKTVNVTVSGAGKSITTTGAITTGAAGNISLAADDLILGGNLSGTGTLTLQPVTTTRAVYVNYGAADGTNFNLSTAELGYLVDGWSLINVGNTATSVTGYYGASAWVDPINFRSAAARLFLGAVTGTGNTSFNFTGNTSWVDLYSDISTAGGFIDMSNMSYLYTSSGAATKTISTAGGNILTNIVFLGSNDLLLNAGTGSISFKNRVDGSKALTATAASMTFTSAWGASTALGDVTLNSTSSIVLPSITFVAGKSLNVTVSGAGNSITANNAIAMGAAGNITLTADDLTLGANLSGTGTITLQPYNTSRSYNVAYGTADGTVLHLTAAEIAYLVNGWSQINIGRTNGAATSNIGTSSWVDPITFRNNAKIVTYGTITTTDTAPLTINTGAGYIDATGTINSDGAVTITTGTVGYISYGSVINANNSNITFSGNVRAGYLATGAGSLTLNAGTGTITLPNGVNTNQSVAASYDFTATAGSFVIGGALGGTTALGNVTLNSVNSITLPAITTAAGKNVVINVSGAGSSITTTGAISTSAAGNITLTSDDLILGGALSGTGILTLQPYSYNRVMYVNYGTANGTNYNLSTADIAYIADGWDNIIIGRVTSGTSYQLGTSNWLDRVYFRTSSSVDVRGTITTSGTDSISFSSTYWNLQPGSNITAGGDLIFQGVAFGYGASTLRSLNGNINFNNNFVNYNTNIRADNGRVTFNGVSTAANLNLWVNAKEIAFNTASWSGTFGNVSLIATEALILPKITGATILAQTTGVGSDITLGAGAVLTASGSGNAITLASARNFINNSGSSTPLVLTGSGRYLIYSASPTGDTLNGMTSGFVRYGCTYGGSCPTGTTISATGNGSIYVYQPTLTVTPNVINTIYGNTAPSLVGYGYSATGYLTGAAGADGDANIFTGTLTGTSSYAQGNNVGNYNLDYSSGTLTSSLGYAIVYANNASGISVGQRTLVTTLAGVIGKTYDGNNTATLTSGNYTLGNVYGSDALTITNTAGTYNDKNAGTGKTITVNGLTLSGTNASNYVLDSTSVSGAVGTVLQKSLTLVGVGADNKVYDATTGATLNGTAAFSGLIGSDVVNIGGTAVGTFSDKNVGIGKTVTVSGYTISGTDALNYNFSQPTGITANISQKALTLVGLAATDKTYDGSTSATLTGTAGLDGLLATDDVDIDGTGVAMFANKNVGTGKTVTITGYSISGGDANNYNFSQPTGVTADVSQRTVTVVGLSADNKVYDGNSSAILNGTASFSGILGSDDVNLDGTGVGAFSDKNVGTGKTITVSGYSISGADAGNYVFSEPTGITANITQKSLTLTGLSGTNKIYDGNTIAAISGTAAFSGLVGSDDVNLGGVGVGAFSDKNVATGKTITVSGYSISGTDAANYNFSQPTGITANITAKALTLSGLSGSNKVYDGNTTAALTGTATFSGLVGSDAVTLNGTGVGAFSDKDAGTGKTITVTGYSISGGDANNYSFTQPTGVVANITQKVLTIVGLGANNKVYDGNTAATLTGTAAFSGLVGSDNVTLTGTGVGTFSDKNAGTGKTITVTGYGTSGTDAGNYSLVQPTGVVANITQKLLTIVGLGANNKVYDGNTVATINGTASFSGLVGSDVVTLGGTGVGAFSDKNAATGKTVTVSGYTISGTDAANYNFAQPTGVTANITQKLLTVTADSKSVVYGATAPAGSLSYSGFVTGENAGMLTTAPTVASTATGIKDAGTYAGNYIASGGADTNYSFAYVAGNLTVLKRALTVTTNNIDNSSGTLNPVFTGSDNLLAADAALISWTYAPIGYTNGDAGIYTIGATANDTSGRLNNYIRTNNYGQYNVGVAPYVPPVVPSQVISSLSVNVPISSFIIIEVPIYNKEGQVVSTKKEWVDTSNLSDSTQSVGATDFMMSYSDGLKQLLDMQ